VISAALTDGGQAEVVGRSELGGGPRPDHKTLRPLCARQGNVGATACRHRHAVGREALVGERDAHPCPRHAVAVGAPLGGRTRQLEVVGGRDMAGIRDAVLEQRRLEQARG
jgi:hypothetical protein